jgi:hypothetical protein
LILDRIEARDHPYDWLVSELTVFANLRSAFMDASNIAAIMYHLYTPGGQAVTHTQASGNVLGNGDFSFAKWARKMS